MTLNIHKFGDRDILNITMQMGPLLHKAIYIGSPLTVSKYTGRRCRRFSLQSIGPQCCRLCAFDLVHKICDPLTFLIHNQSYIKPHKYSDGRLGHEQFRLYVVQLVVCVHDELIKLFLSVSTGVHGSKYWITDVGG